MGKHSGQRTLLGIRAEWILAARKWRDIRDGNLEGMERQRQMALQRIRMDLLADEYNERIESIGVRLVQPASSNWKDVNAP